MEAPEACPAQMKSSTMLFHASVAFSKPSSWVLLMRGESETFLVTCPCPEKSSVLMWHLGVLSLTVPPQISSSWPKASTCMQPGSSGVWSCASCLILAPLLWSSGITVMRLSAPNTRRISWASQKACPKLLNIKPTRCNLSVFPCRWGGCGVGRGQKDTPTGLGTEPHNTFYTHMFLATFAKWAFQGKLFL